VPCTVVRIAPGRIAEFAARHKTGEEAAARHFRYRALRREAGRLSAYRILVAHTADDVLETILMRVLRGAGPGGLAPIAADRNGVRRPLLQVGRREITAYLEGRGIAWRSDATNADPRYLRNRVRNVLVPLLDREFPAWRRGVLAMAETQALAAEFIGTEAARLVRWEGAKDGRRQVSCNMEDFRAAAEIVREEAIFQAADLLAADNGSGAPRRAAVRKFAEGELKADLGPVTAEVMGGRLCVSGQAAGRRAGRGGWTLVAGTPGEYRTPDGRKVRIGDDGGLDAGTAHIMVERRDGGRGTVFPVVLRGMGGE
jgi:tRNA(Ile)-lysidine synthase